jgi:hypothetical protein
MEASELSGYLHSGMQSLESRVGLSELMPRPDSQSSPAACARTNTLIKPPLTKRCSNNGARSTQALSLFFPSACVSLAQEHPTVRRRIKDGGSLSRPAQPWKSVLNTRITPKQGGKHVGVFAPSHLISIGNSVSVLCNQRQQLSSLDTLLPPLPPPSQTPRDRPRQVIISSPRIKRIPT